MDDLVNMKNDPDIQHIFGSKWSEIDYFYKVEVAMQIRIEHDTMAKSQFLQKRYGVRKLNVVLKILK